MKDLISLICKYDKDKHLKYVSKNENFSVYQLERLKSNIWKTNNDLIPYHIITYLLDAYFCFPERLDMGFLFLWQCINNIYNELQFHNNTVKKSTDTKGIEFFIEMMEKEFPKTIIYNCRSIKVEDIFDNYVSKCPLKLYRFVSNYILKNYVIEANFASVAPKMLSSSYLTFKKNNNRLFTPIIDTYGKAFEENCNPQLDTNDLINLGIFDNEKSRKIIHSLANSLYNLINNGSVSISRINDHILTVNKRQKIEFIFRDLIYAVRCNSFHGNIASRLNSLYADKNSLEASKFIFYITHFFINMGLISQGKMELDDIRISIKNFEHNYTCST